MPIRLIADTERYVCQIGDTRLFYRRVPSYIQSKIEHTHTQRGVTNQRAVVEEVLQYAIVGWDNVQDADGNPVAFSPELLKYLGESAKAEIIGKLYESDPGDLIKNSGNS